MAKPDIRMETCLIIRKGNEYLVGRRMIIGGLKWSISPWDAWRTRVRANARSVAEKLSCDIYLFNPIAGQIREYRDE